MDVHTVGDADRRIFLRYSAGRPLAGCVGTIGSVDEPVRVTFGQRARNNLLIVGRSHEVALGICTMLLLDLAAQIVSMPNRKQYYTTPPFSIMDYLGTVDSHVFTDAALSLPLATKLERATDTVMTTVNDLHRELVKRTREPKAPRHAKFMFLCGLQAAHGIRSRGSYAATDVNRRAAAFAQILRDGPSVSLHAVVWCNSIANIELTMSEGLDHFDHVVLLGDIAHPPSDLGVSDGAGRAQYIDRRTGSAIPISPFSLPSEEWCDAAVRSMTEP